jgi:hypothetical protein
MAFHRNWIVLCSAGFLASSITLLPGRGLAEEGPNLLTNGDFEAARPVSPAEWQPHLDLGWMLGGNRLYPDGWELGEPKTLYVPGIVEVVEAPHLVKQGKRCLRLSTPGGSSLLRTTLTQKFPIPPSRCVAWSFWVRGTYGLDRERKAPGARYCLGFEVPCGGVMKSGGGSPTGQCKLEWEEVKGTTYFPEADGEWGRVILYAYQASSNTPATLFYDDVRVTAAPAPPAPPEQGPPPPPTRPSLVARRDFDVPDWWPPPLPPPYEGGGTGGVAGQPFRFMFQDYVSADPQQVPRFHDLLRRSAALVYLKWTPPAWLGPDAPFMVYMLRWNEGQFHHPAIARYGLGVPLPITYEPRKALDGLTDLPENGWASEGPPPQWLQLDLGLPVPATGVRVFCPWADGRATAYQVEVSPDGKAWEQVATATGPNPAEGRLHPLSGAAVQHVRLTITADSAGFAHVNEIQVLGPDGNVLPVMFAEASSSRPFTPIQGVPTLHERREELRKAYGERFLGYMLAEWENDIGTGYLDKWRRSTQDPERWRSLQATYPFRFVIPQTAEESAAVLGEAFRWAVSVYGGDVIAHCGWNGWEHYGCEWGSSWSAERL